MPRVKGLTESDRLDAKVRGAIAGAMEEYRMENKRVAKALGVSVNTVVNRKRRPETLTLREIRALKRLFPGIEIQ